jgi:hypothetical protein
VEVACSVGDTDAGIEPQERPLVLVGHRGAGALLPAIRQESGRPVAAHLFVDADIPQESQSGLGSPEAAEFAS